MLFRFNGIIVAIPLAILFGNGLRAAGLGSPQARRAVAAAVAGAAVPVAVHALFAYWRFGTPFSTGYDLLATLQIDRPLNLPLPLWHAVDWQAVHSLLIGPGKGLFTYSPLLAIALWGMWIDRAPRGLFWLGCLAALAGNVALSAAFVAPDGCWSWGPRLQVHLLPLFAYPAWIGTRDVFARRMGRPLVILALALGFFFQFCALVAPDRLEYSQLQRQWVANPDSCRIVQEHQFALRVRNIATIVEAVARTQDISGLPDRILESEFGSVWGVRLVRRTHGWLRAGVFLAWLTILAAAVVCLYRAWTLSRTEPIRS
jgi:hypothetical protein